MKYDNPTKNNWRSIFDNTTKNKWRRNTWNQIKYNLAHITNRTPRVLCLAGDTDLDRVEALRVNLAPIAVDRDANGVKAFRRNGGTAMQCDLHDAILTMKPDGVIGDMYGGVVDGNVTAALDAACICDAVSFNLLRGRDKGISYIDGKVPLKIKRGKIQYSDIGNHRGKILFAILVETMCVVGGLGRELPDGMFQCDTRSYLGVAIKLRPKFYSYKSRSGNAVQWYDTVHISTAFGSLPPLFRNANDVSGRVKRKAAAAKALTTMRFGA